MKRVGKNSIALGLVMALVSLALSFSASGAPTYTSYGEAQYVAAADNALGGKLLDPLVDAVVEDPAKGGRACEPATDKCPASAGTSSPLGDALLPLTGALGDALGGVQGVGVIGDYAKAGGGASQAASGAVTGEGAIDLASAGDSSKTSATFSLSAGALEPIASALADVKLNIGAVAATAKLDSPTSSAVRDYGVAGGTVTLNVPALAAFNTAISGAVSPVLVDPVVLDATTVCQLLTTLGQSLPPLVDCNVASTLDGVISGQITGLASVLQGLTDLTTKAGGPGVSFDFATGNITIDIKAAAEAALGKDLNDLPPNTDILKAALQSVTLNLDNLVKGIQDNIVNNVFDNVKLSATVLGVPLPPLDLNALGATGLQPVLNTVLTGLTDALATVGDPLSEALGTIVDGLGNVVQLTVNVPDLYATNVAAKRAGGVVGGTGIQAVGDSAGPFSETALRITVLGGQLADLLLGNALVGPNAEGPDDQADAATSDADNTTADGTTADGTDAAAVADADIDANADAAADANADAAADADVTSALPNTGSPNVLPLLLLALGLIGFGTAVLANEKRRLAKQ